MTAKEAAEALDLLEKNRSVLTRDDTPPSDDFEMPEGLEDCKIYHIDVMCWYGTTPYQFKITTLLTDQEAYMTSNELAKAMYNLATMGQSSFSIKLRGQDGRIVSRVFTGVVYMEHDIPVFKDVAEDENAE